MPTNGHTKRAFVCSGGGSKGQFAVGVLRHLLFDLQIHFDILCGVSVGALICSYLAQYDKGEEQEAYRGLEALFSSITNDDVWRNWFPFGKIMAPWRPSLLDSTPLEDKVRSTLSEARVAESDKQLRIGAVSLTTGNYQVFNQYATPLSEAVLASASFPGAFKPVRYQSEWWTDGGVRTVTPLQAAIDAGADEIYAVTLSPKNHAGEFDPDPNAFDVALRAIELMSEEVIANDIKVAEVYNRLIAAGAEKDKRMLDIMHFRPKRPINEDSLDFSRKRAKQEQNVGYQIAVEEMAA